jgi:hypothetical protein
MPDSLPRQFAATRVALHSLAEHVLAPARHRAEGRIGLTPSPGGFGTPAFGDGERIRVEGVELVHERPGSTTRVGVTTLGAAAQFVGIPLGAPADVYPPVTAADPDAPLAIDAESARRLAEWFAFGAMLLDELRSTYAAADPSPVTLWPEHFDLACDLGDASAGTRANYGASPGDDAIAEPYLYVGPWDATRRVGPLGAHGFGAALTYGELCSADDPRAAARDFLFDGAALLVGQP